MSSSSKNIFYPKNTLDPMSPPFVKKIKIKKNPNIFSKTSTDFCDSPPHKIYSRNSLKGIQIKESLQGIKMNLKIKTKRSSSNLRNIYAKEPEASTQRSSGTFSSNISTHRRSILKNRIGNSTDQKTDNKDEQDKDKDKDSSKDKDKDKDRTRNQEKDKEPKIVRFGASIPIEHESNGQTFDKEAEVVKKKQRKCKCIIY